MGLPNGGHYGLQGAQNNTITVRVKNGIQASLPHEFSDIEDPSKTHIFIIGIVCRIVDKVLPEKVQLRRMKRFNGHMFYVLDGSNILIGIIPNDNDRIMLRVQNHAVLKVGLIADVENDNGHGHDRLLSLYKVYPLYRDGL
jgi:hypothetical protein